MGKVLRLLGDIRRRPWYYWNSVWIRTYRKLSPRGFFDRTIFARTERDLDHYDSIVFVLNHRINHIGDQLFFLPLIYLLAARGYPVVVDVSPILKFLFPDELLTRPVGRRPLYVSRLPILPSLHAAAGTRLDFFMLDQLSLKIREPLGLFIRRTFCEYFRLADVPADMSPEEVATLARPVPLSDKLKPLAGRPVIIMSNYIDSGHHLRNPATIARLLADVATHKAQHGGTVIHLGTAADRAADPVDYGQLVDVDLRGTTGVADLFAMFGSLDIARVYTCDTAVLHIARMYGLPVSIYWRSRKTRDLFIHVARIYTHFFDRTAFDREYPPAVRGTMPI